MLFNIARKLSTVAQGDARLGWKLERVMIQYRIKARTLQIINMDNTTNTTRAATLYSECYSYCELKRITTTPTDLQVFNVTECLLANGETPSTSSFQCHQ